MNTFFVQDYLKCLKLINCNDKKCDQKVLVHYTKAVQYSWFICLVASWWCNCDLDSGVVQLSAGECLFGK